MTDDYEHYEAVVVGAGPGGAAAAAALARNGIETLVLERGTEPGSKNVSGGLIYAEESAPYTIDDLFPTFRREASERPITEYHIHNVAGRKVKSYDITQLHEHDTAWSDTVLRRHMDSWLADQVHEITRETGGGLLTGVRVNGLLRENGEIVGVTCDELDPIKADFIVAADGVNSELARDAGLMDWEDPDEWFQGVKAVIDVPSDVIADRFDVGPNEGVAHLFSGNLFEDVRGGGFLYTNEDSLSIGTVFHLDSLVEQGAEPHELLDNLLTHPLLAQWLDGHYDEVEYSAKLVPDGKKAAHPSPHMGRLALVGDAAGQMQAAGPIIKGMNHAVTAGALAGEAFADAKARGNPHQAGRLYEQKLRTEGVMEKLKPTRYSVSSALGENGLATSITDGLLKSPVGRIGLKALSPVLGKLYSSPFMSTMIPDTQTPYVTLPTVIAETLGSTITDTTDGVAELAAMDADLVLNGVAGAAGLPSTLAALGAGTVVALANKESLIIGGDLVVAAAERAGGREAMLVPVDSEHSALAQCLRGGRAHEVARLVLTASGGPFRGRNRQDLADVTPAQALDHPTWSMGPVITVNSATLMNKGLELIEAHLLFDVAWDRLDTVVHPQSLVHSMVEFVDGSTLAQVSPPDMRLPIQLAMAWPDRLDTAFVRMDWTAAQAWTFEPPDRDAFPALDLAEQAGRGGGTAPAVLNAANERAVDAFLDGILPFLGIAEVVARVLDAHGPAGTPRDVGDVVEADTWARHTADRLIAAHRPSAPSAGPNPTGHVAEAAVVSTPSRPEAAE